MIDTRSLDAHYSAYFAEPGYEGGSPASVQDKSFLSNGKRIVVMAAPPQRVSTASDVRRGLQIVWSRQHAMRAILNESQPDEHLTTHHAMVAARQAKRLCYGLDMSRVVAKVFDRHDAEAASRVRSLVFDVYAVLRNVRAAYDALQAGLELFTGVARQPDIFTLNDPNVSAMESALALNACERRIARMRSELEYAAETLAVGTPTSRWATAVERADAMERIRMLPPAERERDDVLAMRLYENMLTFGIGDGLWRLWQGRLAEIARMTDASARYTEMSGLSKDYLNIHGDKDRPRTDRAVLRQLFEAFKDYVDNGRDADAAYDAMVRAVSGTYVRDEFVVDDTARWDVYQATTAVRMLGWKTLLDAEEVEIVLDADTKSALREVASMLRMHPIPDIHDYRDFNSIMNCALKPVNAAVKSKSSRRVNSRTFYIEIHNPVPNLALFDAETCIGRHAFTAHFARCKHTCNRTCESEPGACPRFRTYAVLDALATDAITHALEKMRALLGDDALDPTIRVRTEKDVADTTRFRAQAAVTPELVASVAGTRFLERIARVYT